MNAPQEPHVTDPDNVPEILCNGRFGVSVAPNGLATMIFTHVRNKAAPIIEDGQIVQESVVRARIVTTHDNLVALRDLLNNMIKDAPATAAATGSGKPN